MSDYLDVIHNETSVIMDMSYKLANLAKAFYVTGNEVMGNKMYAMAEQLEHSQKAITAAVSVEISRSLNESYQSAANTVSACLNMASLDSQTP